MVTWDEMERSVPAAARFREAVARMPVAHLATSRRDGSPRIHPVCPHFTNGRLYVAVNDHSPKRLDLSRAGARYALHSINVDEPGPEFDEFEFEAWGTARRVPNDEAEVWAAVREVCPYEIPDVHWLFELPVDATLSATWDPIGAPGRRAHRLRWEAGWDAPRAPSNEGLGSD